MKSRIPALKANSLIKVLRKIGFFKICQKGSHIFFQHSDGRSTLIPYHKGKDIGRGLLRQILREIKISPEEFINIL